MKISIIMPSLNVASYIGECLKSVTNQTVEDVEILCIDAGSTDGTLDIIKEYVQKDDRIQLIMSDIKSYGYQVNIGIKSANGEYIAIVETDDYISNDALESMYALAQKEDADYVKADFSMFIKEGERNISLPMELEKNYNIEYGGPFETKDFLNYRVEVDPFIWNAIYKSSFLKKCVKLNESKGAAFQDCGFRYQVALNVKRGYYLNKQYYFYRRDNAGSSMYDDRGFMFNMDECRFLAEKYDLDNIRDHDLKSFLVERFISTLLISFKTQVGIHAHDKQNIELLQKLHDMIETYLDNGMLDLQRIPESLKDDLNLLINDMARYESYIYELAQEKILTRKKFAERVNAFNSLIIFGAGKSGIAAYFYIVRNSLPKVVAVCDNNTEKWGKTFYSTVVTDPKEIIEKENQAGIVIASMKYSDQIYKQLIDLGIPDKRIITYECGDSSFECTELAFQRTDER
ncbi:MAG: glycosyltransferase family 2 protein [Butyrivibrio sp.]|nr:glycosyltransferase family 2 protein [Butyrivibrio sp.]